MKDSDKGLVILLVVLLVTGILSYMLLFNHSSHSTNNQQQGTNQTQGNNKINIPPSVNIKIFKENGQIQKIRIESTRNVQQQINIPIKLVSRQETDPYYIIEIYEPTTNITEDEIKTGITFTHNGQKIEPKIQIININTNNKKITTITINNYGETLYDILSTVKTDGTGYISVTIRDVITGRKIFSKLLRVNEEGKLTEIPITLKQYKGTFRVSFLTKENKYFVFYVTAGDKIAVVPKTDKGRIIIWKDSSYYIKITPSKLITKDFKIITSVTPYVFRGVPENVQLEGSSVKLPLTIDEITTLYNGNSIYVLFYKDTSKVYITEIKPGETGGIEIYDNSKKPDPYLLLFPPKGTPVKGTTTKLQYPTQKTIPIIIVSKTPVTIKIYDSNYKQVTNILTYPTRIQNNFNYYILIPYTFTQRYEKLYIHISNNFETREYPVIFDSNSIDLFENPSLNQVLETKNVLMMVDFIKKEQAVNLIYLIPNIKINVPQIKIVNITQETNTTNQTIDNQTNEFPPEYNETQEPTNTENGFIYIGDKSIDSYYDGSTITISGEIVDKILDDPSQPIWIKKQEYDDYGEDYYIIPIEYVLGFNIIKINNNTYEIHYINSGKTQKIDRITLEKMILEKMNSTQ